MIVSVVVLFVTDTRDVFIPDDVFDEEPSELENCVRTKWVQNTVGLTLLAFLLGKTGLEFSNFLQMSGIFFLLAGREQ